MAKTTDECQSAHKGMLSILANGRPAPELNANLFIEISMSFVT